MLGIVWLPSCVLAWWLARRVARPLQALATAVHEVGRDRPLPALPVERTDEIGLLARALTDTHTSLLDERERRRSAERLALLGRMATGLAHEVRNPVAAIRMHAQLLEGAPAEEAATSARLIESEAGRIELLVSQWMCYARPAPPVMTEVALGELVRQVVQILEPQARHAGVTVRVMEPAEALPTIQGDRPRLQQALLNVLLNALQAMPAGGAVTIRTCVTGNKAGITVEDQGRGFSPQAMARFGEPFFSEKEGGMGLGLAVAQELCRAHGGELRAANVSGGGAGVTMELSASSSAAPPSSHPS
jgi:signal transduction histidine kinase